MHALDQDAARRAAPPLTMEPICPTRNGVAVLLLRAGDHGVIRPPGAAGAYGFAFEGSRAPAWGGAGVRPSERRPNALVWIPPGCAIEARAAAGGEYLVVEARAAPTGLAPADGRVAVVDPAAVAAARAIRRALLVRPGPDAPAIEAGVEVLRHVLEARLARPPADDLAWLTAARLDAVDRLIESRAADGLRVPEMAANVGLSTTFFTRAFKRALGVTPHDYLLQKRLVRARRALETTRAPIAEVAFACGFAHQSHLTSLMRRELGVTPRAYRDR